MKTTREGFYEKELVCVVVVRLEPVSHLMIIILARKETPEKSMFILNLTSNFVLEA